MRIVVAELSHETNTFSPVITDLARFSHGDPTPPEGAAALAVYRGTATCLGGFIEVCESAGADIVLPIAAGAAPSGPVENDAFEYIANKIVAAIADGCDAVMLELHGAMVTRTYDDGEGELLRRIREVAPEVPIARRARHARQSVSGDRRARRTLSPGYQTYPHIDMDATAIRAGTRVVEDARRQAPSRRWCGAMRRCCRT